MGREKWIFFLKLIMAMDSMASFGASLQDLLDSALMVDHFAIFSLYTYRFSPHYNFLSKPLARLILAGKDPLVAHSH